MIDFISNYQNKKIPIKDICQAYATENPSLSNAPDFHILVTEHLKQLEKDLIVKLPSLKGNGWHSYHRGCPDYVMKITQDEKREKQNIVWIPELAFAEKIKDTQRKAQLVRLNTWIKENGRPKDNDRIPFKERCLEVFGYEKAVLPDQNLTTFFSGAVPLDLFGAFIPDTPLFYEKCEFSRTKKIIISEKSDSWWTLCAWNKLNCHFAAVVYGGGNGIHASWTFLDNILAKSNAEHIDYIGDIDEKGIVIPSGLSKKRECSYRPPVLPCFDMYQYMLKHGIRQQKKCKHTKKKMPWLQFLEDEVAEVLSSGAYIAQETITKKVLSKLYK